MIKGYQSTQPLRSEPDYGFQWVPALLAGFLAGVIFLLVPQGTPWSALTFFSPVIMGRPVPLAIAPPLLLVWLLHLLIALIYGLIISKVVVSLRKERAIIAGGVTGIVLYLLNFVLVSFIWPELRGREIGVLFTHFAFGLIAAGAYRGLLHRKIVSPAISSF